MITNKATDTQSSGISQLWLVSMSRRGQYLCQPAQSGNKKPGNFHSGTGIYEENIRSGIGFKSENQFQEMMRQIEPMGGRTETSSFSIALFEILAKKDLY